MQTEEFACALDRLVAMSAEGSVAMMCAEGNPHRCHRSLVADALAARGVRVLHISGERPGRLHRITPFATVVNDRVEYPERSEGRTAGQRTRLTPKLLESSKGVNREGSDQPS
jgi:hypothetical protein